MTKPAIPPKADLNIFPDVPMVTSLYEWMAASVTTGEGAGMMEEAIAVARVLGKDATPEVHVVNLLGNGLNMELMSESPGATPPQNLPIAVIRSAMKMGDIGSAERGIQEIEQKKTGREFLEFPAELAIMSGDPLIQQVFVARFV